MRLGDSGGGRQSREHPRQPRRHLEPGHICPKGATLGALHDDPDRHPAPDGQGRRRSGGRSAGTRRSGAAPNCSPRSSSEHGIGAVTVLHRQPARALLLARPLHRRAARHVGHPAELLAGHRRPVAEEPVVAPDVRRHGGRFPVPDIAAHRPARRDGRQPAASQGSLLAAPDVMGDHRRNPQARQGDRDRPRPHGAPPRAPTSGCRSRRAPTPRCCWPSPTRCSPRTSSTSGGLAPHIDGLDRMRAVAADWSPERVAAVTEHRRRAHPRAGA